MTRDEIKACCDRAMRRIQERGIWSRPITDAERAMFEELATYASNRVFEGKRALSDERIEALRRNYMRTHGESSALTTNDDLVVECMAMAAADEACKISDRGIAWQDMTPSQQDFARSIMRVALRVSRSEAEQIQILLLEAGRK